MSHNDRESLFSMMITIMAVLILVLILHTFAIMDPGSAFSNW